MASGPPCFKVILCGEYGVGKSSLFRRFLDNSFTQDTGPRSTIGLDHVAKPFTVDNKQIKLELWDTAGIERFATLSSSYFQSAGAAILCYAINNRDSFDMLSQHILDAVMHSRTAKIFLCGIKEDLTDEEAVTDDDIKDLRIQCDAVLSGVYRVSCKTGQGVGDMFADVAQVLFHEAEQKFDPSRVKAHEPVAPPPSQKSGCC